MSAMFKLSHAANVVNEALEEQGIAKQTTSQRLYGLASKKNRPDWIQIFPGEGKLLKTGVRADLPLIAEEDMPKLYEWVVNGSTRDEADVKADAASLLAKINGEPVDNTEDEDDPEVDFGDEDNEEAA
jgi:hypothetical protein